MAHGGRAREQQKVHWFPLLGSLKNLTTGLIWLVTRVGGRGEAWGGGPWRAGKGGDGRGAPESSVGATKGALPPFGLPKKPNNWSDLAGDEGGGGQGGRWGGAPESSVGATKGANWGDARVGGGGGPWRAGKGGDGGGPQRAVWEQQKMHWFPLLALIWLVPRVGGWGEAWGGGPWRAGKGGWGGAPESSVGATKDALVPFWLPKKPNNWSDFAGDEGGGMGEAWGGGPWRAGKGGDGGGPQRAVWEQQKRQWLTFGITKKPNNWSDLAGAEGGGMGGGVGRWPMEGGQGGRWGGAPESSATVAHGGRARGEMGGGPQRAVWEQQKMHWVPPFGLPKKPNNWSDLAPFGTP